MTQAQVDDKCWGKRPEYERCIDEGEKTICVGTESHGYFYKVN